MDLAHVAELLTDNSDIIIGSGIASTAVLGASYGLYQAKTGYEEGKKAAKEKLEEDGYDEEFATDREQIDEHLGNGTPPRTFRQMGRMSGFTWKYAPE